jgi:hypothetical protein
VLEPPEARATLGAGDARREERDADRPAAGRRRVELAVLSKAERVMPLRYVEAAKVANEEVKV